jgi:DNA-binding IclR family transcriptional regulator
LRIKGNKIVPMTKGNSRKSHILAAVENSQGDQYFSRAVSKSFEILELLQSSHVPMGLHEIAQRIGLSKTSAFRLLRTLETCGCLQPTGSGEYHRAVGIRSIVPTLWLARLHRVARAPMQDLCHTINETISLAALFDNHMEVIAVVECRQMIRMSNVVGHILPPNASSLGKVITAFQPSDVSERLIKSYGLYRFTERSITDRMKLEGEFSRIREQGFAVDREESVAEGICFGVPVRNSAGEVRVALSTSFPKARVRDSEHEKSIVGALHKAAAQILAALEISSQSSRPELGA